MENKSVKDMTIQEIDECLEFGKELKERLKPEIEIIRNINEDDDVRESKKFDVTFNKFLEQQEEINTLTHKKEDLIKQTIGQMYKGVLIDQELSIRKDGEIYSYKRQSNYGLNVLKKKILANIFEVQDKIGDNNLDILEFVLNYVSDEEKKEEKQDLHFILPSPVCFVDMQTNYHKDDYNELEFYSILRIRFRFSGEIDFFENVNEDNDYSDYRYRSNGKYLPDRQKELLLKKYESHIKVLFEETLKQSEDKINHLKQEIEEIKDKASPLLVIAQLKKDNKNMMELKQ